MSRRTVILGAPGAGKGTQAQKVCSRLDLVHLSTGDLLRGAVAAGTPAGQKAGALMEAGQLVPDEVVFSVLFEQLEGAAGGEGQAKQLNENGYMLDGFPRNRAQAAELDRRLAGRSESLDAVIDMDVPDERLLGRITGRRVCKACGLSFHVEFVPPAKEGVCDGCDSPLTQRSDDVEAVVAERLAVYHEQTAPLIDYYEGRGVLLKVDGDQDVEAVTEAVLEALSQSNPNNDLAGHS